MSTHKSHDWDSHGFCVECTAHCMSMEAQYQCRPSTDDSRPCDSEPAREIDYSAITKALSA